MTLPLLISVPHSGLIVPTEVESYCLLSTEQIIKDGDEGAAAIYHGLSENVAAFVSTTIARAIVDVNRAKDDRRADGIVKTHTCWNVQVYKTFPSEEVIEFLLDRYYHPYHADLTRLADTGVLLGVDCHTMAAEGPPIGPDPGKERPWVCLSNGDETCSGDWITSLAECFANAFKHEIAINEPFRGGYIVREHSRELPWVQLELSRAPFMSDHQKHACVLAALQEWCSKHA